MSIREFKKGDRVIRVGCSHNKVRKGCEYIVDYYKDDTAIVLKGLHDREKKPYGYIPGEFGFVCSGYEELLKKAKLIRRLGDKILVEDYMKEAKIMKETLEKLD